MNLSLRKMLSLCKVVKFSCLEIFHFSEFFFIFYTLDGVPYRYRILLLGKRKCFIYVLLEKIELTNNHCSISLIDFFFEISLLPLVYL